MPTSKNYVTLVPFTDENGLHAAGDVVTLPFDTIYEKMDAYRLVDYGIVAENDRPRKKNHKD
jgi:hypothetical protein